MTPTAHEIPIHDIKPLMEVPDSSLTFLILGLSVVFLLLFGGGYLFYKHFKALENVDFSDPKKAAYAITEHGRFFVDDAPRLKEAYENMVERLEVYKYRRDVTPISDESRSYYKIYLEMIDV